MAEREYAVRVFDSAPGQGLAIEPVGSLQRAQQRVAYYQAINETRGTYGIRAEAVYRYTFMPDMGWEEVAGA